MYIVHFTLPVRQENLLLTYFFYFQITRPLVFVIVCFGFFILLQSLVPKVMALKNSNVDEYMLEDQRTRKRKNYVVRLARDSEILGNSGNLGTNYDTDSFQPDPTNPEELSAFIVDYANMIRNDVILLDKSVETRTRKRGNIQVKKYNNVSTFLKVHNSYRQSLNVIT